MVIRYDRRYVNRLADIYLQRLDEEDGHRRAKDWLYRSFGEDFDLINLVLDSLDQRAKVRGVALCD